MKEKLQRLGAEFRNTKTLGDWINKAKGKTLLNRRLAFGKYSDLKIPALYFYPNGVGLQPFKSKEVSHLTVFPDHQGIRYFYQDRDITPRKNEKFKTWQKRTSISNRSKSASLENLFFSEAMAIGPGDALNNLKMIQALISSLNSDQWKEFQLDDKSLEEIGLYSTDFDHFIATVNYMKDNNALTCTDEKATFKPTGSRYPVEIDLDRMKSISTRILDGTDAPELATFVHDVSAGGFISYNENRTMSDFSTYHDREAIPRLYEKLYGKTFNQDHTFPFMITDYGDTPKRTPIPSNASLFVFFSESQVAKYACSNDRIVRHLKGETNLRDPKQRNSTTR